MQQLRPLDYWLHYKVMQATGVEQALGGEAQALAALKALAEDYERQARGAQADVPRMIPAAFTGEGMNSGLLGLGIASFGGLVSGGMVSGMVSDMSDDRLAELTRAGPVQLGGKDGGYAIAVAPDGSLSQDISFEGKVAEGLTGKVKVKTKMDACPDASGKVTVESDVDSTMQVAGKPGTGGYVRSHFVYERYLDDDAHLVDGPDGSSSNLRISLGGTENGRDQSLDLTTGWTRGGTELFTEHGHSGFSIFRMDEAQRAMKMVESAQLLQTLMAEVMLRGMKQAPWESGRCIRLDARSTPSKRSGAKPSTSFDVVAAPRVKADGSMPGGSVRATLDGGQSLARDGEKLAPDARYAYVAPSKKDQSASIAFEARSKRGVGRATLAFDTKEQQAYRIAGGQNDFVANTVACSLGRPFDIPSSAGMVMHMSGGEGGGSWTLSGHAAGVAWSGGGRYTVALDGGDGSGTLQATGTSTITSPMGRFSDSVAPVFSLTPVEQDCTADGAPAPAPQ
ncbi:hypothetical protein [Pseudoxanthomonas sp. 10H]|uniref:hypothetical protein n=1 Tax=Pseudoxanthomonas sp. 10H TaxID=3242729 RepID=UPI0035561969